MTASTHTQIPGYVVGTWDIDPVHSDVSFTVRHMMVSKVRGRLAGFSGEIVTAPEFTDSTVTATVDATSIDTGNGQRDGHLRSRPPRRSAATTSASTSPCRSTAGASS
jgi:polyisoprenoid-binding protein YceI